MSRKNKKNKRPDRVIAEGPACPDLGPCCCCQKIGPTVRNLITLPFRAPAGEDGRRIGGWGCAVCHLPCEGAVAVMCDGCIEEKRELVEACAGYPASGERLPMAALTEPFDHDPARHREFGNG